MITSAPTPRARVLLARNGELLEAYRVCFVDQTGWDIPEPIKGYQVALVQSDGYVIKHPISDVPWFLNAEILNMGFQDLGEL